MQLDEFYGHVQERSHLDTRDRTETATAAVLDTLGETLTQGQAEDVARQLPPELGDRLADATHDGAGYDRDDFTNRVSERLQEDDPESDDVARYIEAVTDAIAASLTMGERENLTAQLDAELQPLFEGVTVDHDEREQ
ncbi:DUF2267 domain-containing protein [Natrialba sp. SSL1]|uniref:DUF2267 domain-containing protein n=1 Tax=Natrialba sp. SSL1 TaxID=1869245 RepID=UPI0008F84084|nr:DUF2267 domain-containing protein [Natrialba sp. SSL1]OIB56329.1 hypothetical protein BBD46_18400 [Natrialba sp. SSL1]